VVVGIDAVATSSSVRVTFDGRIGVPIKPGVTTTSKAYFRAVSTSRGVEAFQPWIGCVPSKSSKGRTTVSARVSPGPDLDRRARIVVVHPGSVSIGSVGCPAGEPLVGSWDALGFLTKDPPDLRAAGLVNVTREVSGGKVVVTAGATDSLRTDAHAVVQAGAVCAP
jgi:hypothetical protein